MEYGHGYYPSHRVTRNKPLANPILLPFHLHCSWRRRVCKVHSSKILQLHYSFSPAHLRLGGLSLILATFLTISSPLFVASPSRNGKLLIKVPPIALSAGCHPALACKCLPCNRTPLASRHSTLHFRPDLDHHFLTVETLVDVTARPSTPLTTYTQLPRKHQTPLHPTLCPPACLAIATWWNGSFPGGGNGPAVDSLC